MGSMFDRGDFLKVDTGFGTSVLVNCTPICIYVLRLMRHRELCNVSEL